METTFSNLVDMMQKGAVPAWLREHVNSKRDEITRTLRQAGVYTFNAPDGEQITIRAEKQTAATV